MTNRTQLRPPTLIAQQERWRDQCAAHTVNKEDDPPLDTPYDIVWQAIVAFIAFVLFCIVAGITVGYLERRYPATSCAVQALVGLCTVK